MALLTDDEISFLIAEKKPVPKNFPQTMKLREKRGHKEYELKVMGEAGHAFQLIIRQANINPLDFSIILSYNIPNSNQVFRLCRCNGRHQHSNPLERQTFYDCHIHRATQRYQDAGAREDTYATPTDRFDDLLSALDCMLKDGGFELPSDPQLKLFQ